MEMKKYKLGEIANFVEERISSEDISLDEYVTTDSLLQNKKGRVMAQNLPPKKCSLTYYKKGDVLIGNIRPYLKKIWLADTSGGCSQDVLVFRSKKDSDSEFLYATLMQDDFFDYVMKATKGSKMPRGDKNHIMHFICFDVKNKNKIGELFSSLDKKIALNSRINSRLEQMAKRLYEHYFVQFDFPTEDGKPYKTSGGKMVYSSELKREIPEGWEVGNLYEIADYINGLACQNYRPKENEDYLPVIKIREMNDGISGDTEKVSANIPEKYKIKDGDILFSWSASLEVIIWNGGKGGLNQHIFKVVPKGYFSKEYVYQQLSKYVINFQKQAEARKTTMGHITSEHIKQSRVLLPKKEVIESFTQKVKAMYQMQTNIQQESTRLTSLRDRLLPLLMNGQVSV